MTEHNLRLRGQEPQKRQTGPRRQLRLRRRRHQAFKLQPNPAQAQEPAKAEPKNWTKSKMRPAHRKLRGRKACHSPCGNINRNGCKPKSLAFKEMQILHGTGSSKENNQT